MDRQAAYKFQANAEYKKAQRNKAVDTKRKQDRCSIMMTNRRLPLEEKNQIIETADKGTYRVERLKSEIYLSIAGKKNIGKEDRLQKLKEWQEKRNALREQEKKKQRKPFYTGSSNIGQVNKTGPTINPTVTNKPVTRLQLRNATNKLLAAQNQHKQTKPVTQAQGNVVTLSNKCML